METSKNPSSAKTKSASLSGKDKVSIVREYGESLVGSRIRVWWPMDHQFYKGVVDSYDSARKKHQVLYDDGDKENLSMKRERWELIEEDDAKADEISLQDEPTNESSDTTPEPKTAKSNGESSEKGREDDAIPKKKQKIDSSAKSKSKTRSSKKSEDSEGAKSDVKKADKPKDDEKQTPKPESGKNGKMGDIGGKIVAAASRMSGRFQNKENGEEKETPKSLKSSKKISASNNPKQKRPSSSSEAVSEKVKKSRTSSKKIKSINTTNEEDDTSDDKSKPLKKTSASNNQKQKRPSSSSEDVSEKVKKPRTSAKKIKSNNSEDEGGEDDNVDDTSDDDSKPLVTLLKKSPEAMEALMEKLKGKKEKETGEGSSGNEAEVEAVEES